MAFKCKFLEEEKRTVDKSWKINEQSEVSLRERDCLYRESDLIIFGSLPVIACSKKVKREEKCKFRKFVEMREKLMLVHLKAINVKQDLGLKVINVAVECKGRKTGGGKGRVFVSTVCTI